MKEFDLEKAKAGAAVCTRNGKPARIVCWDAIGEQLPILALVTEENIIGELSEFTYWYNEKGKSDDDYESDLMMATVKREGWVLVDDNVQCGRSIFPSWEIAMDYMENIKTENINGGRDYKIAHIEWEE